MISAAGKNRAASAANRCISTAPRAKFGATITFGSPPSSSISLRISSSSSSDQPVVTVLDAPPHIVHHDLGVREIHGHLHLRLEQPIQLVGDGDVQLRMADLRSDRLAHLGPVDRGDQREVGLPRHGSAHHLPHPSRSADDADPDHAGGSLPPLNGPSIARASGWDRTRLATRRASSSVTVSIRWRIWFTVRISPCEISDLPRRDIRLLGSSSDRTSDPCMWPLARWNSSSESAPSATSASCSRTRSSTSLARAGVVPAYAANRPASVYWEW